MTPDRAENAGHRASDCRCDCGSLLARVVRDGIELKRRSGKRLLLVPVETGVEPGPRLELIAVGGTGVKL